MNVTPFQYCPSIDDRSGAFTISSGCEQFGRSKIAVNRLHGDASSYRSAKDAGTVGARYPRVCRAGVLLASETLAVNGERFFKAIRPFPNRAVVNAKRVCDAYRDLFSVVVISSLAIVRGQWTSVDVKEEYDRFRKDMGQVGRHQANLIYLSQGRGTYYRRT